MKLKTKDIKEYQKKYWKIYKIKNQKKLKNIELKIKKIILSKEKWRRANPQKIAEYVKKWRKKNPEKYKEIKKDGEY